MNILTFDTSLNKTYVTLSSDKAVLSSVVVENHNEKYHSAFLIPTLVKILKEHNLTMQDIDAIGTNVGPGSFTGIRACVTVARVFAQQLEIPLVGVSSLEVLSYLNKDKNKTLILLDARKNQYYTAVYENGEEISAPKLTDFSDVLKLNLSECFIISDASSNKFLKENGFDSLIYSEGIEDLGLCLNELVDKKLGKADVDEFLWGKLKPLYLQTPPVTVSSKSKV